MGGLSEFRLERCGDLETSHMCGRSVLINQPGEPYEQQKLYESKSTDADTADPFRLPCPVLSDRFGNTSVIRGPEQCVADDPDIGLSFPARPVSDYGHCGDRLRVGRKEEGIAQARVFFVIGLLEIIAIIGSGVAFGVYMLVQLFTVSMGV